MMGKKWAKYYLLLGTVIIVAISLIGSMVFVRTNINQAQDKYEFESIYINTEIDFIIPSPSYAQISEIQTEANGIEVVKPYYETSTPVSVDEQICKGTTLLFSDTSNLDVTPYGSKRMISVTEKVQPGTAVIDKLFAETNGCSAGDQITISINDIEYEFAVVGVSENNTYCSDGSVALFLMPEDAVAFETSGIRYSAAYIKATDLGKCKNYLLEDYKPLGRLKDKEEFKSEDTYNQHLANFSNADWSKEITLCSENYETLSVKYQNVPSSILRNTLIYGIIVFLVFCVFNSVLLKNDTLNSYFKAYIIKGNGTKNEIYGFYRNGIAWNVIVFIIANTICCVFWMQNAVLGNPLDGVFGALIPTAVAVIVSVIMLPVSRKYVNKHYSAKRNKDT